MAMAESSGFKTFLYVAENKGDKMVCPFSIRKKEDGYPELVSPYGVGGIIATCSHRKLREFKMGLIEFARQNCFVTAYIMQHPSFQLSKETWGDCLYNHHIFYEIDLTLSIEEIWKEMRKGHRYEVRRYESDTTIKIIRDKCKLKEAILKIYPQTLTRVGASDVYYFSVVALEKLIEARDSIVLGVEDDTGIQAITLFHYTPYVADYFLSASSLEGRKYTRLLIWTAVKALKQLNIPSLNLGGGVKPGDSLEQFKRRFGGRMVRGQVLKQIFDREKYKYLCRQYCAKNQFESNYFPPYWKTR